jgi:hypothetical protein
MQMRKLEKGETEARNEKGNGYLYICVPATERHASLRVSSTFFYYGWKHFFFLVGSSAVVAVAYGRSTITDFSIQRTLASPFGCSLSRKTAIMLLRGASVPIVEFVLK